MFGAEITLRPTKEGLQPLPSSGPGSHCGSGSCISGHTENGLGGQTDSSVWAQTLALFPAKQCDRVHVANWSNADPYFHTIFQCFMLMLSLLPAALKCDTN